MTRKKALAPAPKSCRDAPRELAPSRPASRAYPTLAELRATPSLFSRVAQVALFASAIGSTVTGCATPTCQTTSMDEAKVHGGNALTSLIAFAPGAALEELNVGLGITPHASIAVAGAMMPTSLPPPTIPDAGTTTTIADDKTPIIPTADPIPMAGAAPPVLPNPPTTPTPTPTPTLEPVQLGGAVAPVLPTVPAADPSATPRPDSPRLGGAPPRVDPLLGE